MAFLFTFVIPLTVMTTYPALAIQGRIGAANVVWSLVGAGVACVVARFTWTRAIASYTSAGG